MSKAQQKQLRSHFRRAVFTRAGYRCESCGIHGKDRQGGEEHLRFHTRSPVDLDAHHITNRNEMPNGGYVKANGIALCEPCHLKAEASWSSGIAIENYTPDDLYRIIGSSHQDAVTASERLDLTYE